MTAEEFRQIHGGLFRGTLQDAGRFREDAMDGYVAPEGIAAELDGAFDDFRVDVSQEPGPDGLADAMASLACALAEVRPFRNGNLPACREALRRLAEGQGTAAATDAADAEWLEAALAWLGRRDDLPMRRLMRAAVPGAQPMPDRRKGLWGRFLDAMRLP